ncbi:MAG: acetylornithine transaminase [Betaproteobacteria bacterium]|nr:acetylornithine transaminase [Betaproteobacteria bacterium]
MQASDSLMFITHRPDVEFVRGEGSWLYDAAGRRHLDFVQGWAVNCLGHAPGLIAEALAAQAARVINVSPAYHNAPMRDLAARLAGLSGLEKVFFANSGAEANEGAIKLARKWGARHRGGAFEIIAFEGGFHGRTLATMSASGKPQWEALYAPKVPGFRRLPINDLDAVRAAIGWNTAAVMLEPIQGESGVVPFADEFLRGLRALCDQAGLLLIYDEIQTGVGRTGRMFCWEHAGVRPDIMTLAKGLGGGVPLAALLAKAPVCCFEPGDQGGTFNGNPLMTAVGLAVVDAVAQPAFLARVRENGAYLAARLRALSAERGLGEVRGRGLLLALELGRPVGAALVEAALARGLLINAPRPACLRFMPALNVTREEIDAMLRLLREALTDIDRGPG